MSTCHYLRSPAAAWPDLLAALDRLGLARAVQDADGQPVYIAPTGCAFDLIGPVYRPTGTTDADGHPLIAPLLDPAGEPWQHANLAGQSDPCDQASAAPDLPAETLAAAWETVRAALLPAPQNPYRRFAGDPA